MSKRTWDIGPEDLEREINKAIALALGQKCKNTYVVAEADEA